MSEYRKQLPNITLLDKPFWEAAKKHQLIAYKCLHCGTMYSHPMECIVCDHPEMAWVKVGGKGSVFTFAIYRQPFHPAWKEDIPYNVTWVELDEGPLLMTNIVGCRNEDLYVGMPVEVIFDDITEEITLPKFQPVKPVPGG